MASAMLFVLFASSALTAEAVTAKATMEHRANPIRKVVTMLQSMSKKVEAEGEKEKELYDKFMCYCQTGGGDLQKKIEGAKTKIPQLEADIKEGGSKLAGLKEDLASNTADRAGAKKAMSEATAIREKEAKAYAKESSEDAADAASVKKATAALSRGLAAGFLQTSAAENLRRVVRTKSDLLEDSDRDSLAAFLSMKEGGPGSAEILGILKTMGDEMTKDAKEAAEAEAGATETYEELMAAKKKEVGALTKAIEEKTGRIGTLSVEIVEKKNDLGDTEESLAEDEKVKATLEKSCSTKAKDFEVAQKTRQEELVALAETIKILNDDDALELFKKTLPGASSFLQIQVSAKSVKHRALQVIRSAQRGHKARNLDFIALALRGRKVGFEKVLGMIDEMAANLKKEQDSDNSKKEYCGVEFDKSDDKKKATERSIKDMETVLSDTSEAIDSAAEDIEALTASIKALDKAVAEATAQRKAEHADYVEVMASDGAAKEVLGFAKNRLNKFYNPKLYKAPPKRELSEEDQITVNMGGTLAPTAAPGIAFLQVRQERSESHDSNGVIAMIDLLIKDLDTEMTEAEVTEKDSQGDYEEMMKDSSEKRAQDAKALERKESAKADMEESYQQTKQDKATATKELAATIEYIASLHSECDWLLKYFDVRKEARSGEIDALGKAKAVLNGADYSLLQTQTQHRHLRRA